MNRRFTSILCPTQSFSEVNTKVKDLVLKGLYDQALKLYKEQLHPFALSNESKNFVMPSVIKACAHTETHHLLGLQTHCNVLKTGSDLEPTISNSLISMYAKFSDPENARTLFVTMPQRDTISWNSMINCYIQNGYFLESLTLLKEMYMTGFVPKPELIASVLSVCVRTGNIRLGRVIHGLVIVDERMEKSIFLSTALVDFYWRCPDSLMAFRVFDRMELKNEVSWTAMVSGCVAQRDYAEVLDFFRAMQIEGTKPNRVTLLAILPACAEFGLIKHGEEIHGYAFRHGFDSECCFSSGLIHMYSKCGDALRPAKLIFERSAKKDVVMWSSIIASYSKGEDSGEEAIRLFNQMQRDGIEPNSVTLLAVISACTNLSSLSHGRGVHGYVLKSGFILEPFIGNSLINMYSKCGCLTHTHQIFKEMTQMDSISWSALISAYGLHGCGEEALQLFHEMQETGIEPDEVTILAILSACNHAGLVEEGQKLFSEAAKDDKITLTMAHYACHIDLLGKAGKLEDACDIIRIMPMKPSMRILSSLVSACKLYGRLKVAEMLAHKLIESEPENAANYTLLSMVYAESGYWTGVEEVREEMKLKGLKKSHGFSRIQLKNENLC
ncbi:unnamed protein product [Ilex paraguariensis]|uniref:Pentatricopeptide repeat-containing protein n=1 Tax=Ilex paraguariensis TaxID=185542 RepID=A0ABC8R497_9AQUA